MDDSTQVPASKPRYVWPWFLAAAVVLAVVIAVFAVWAEAKRVQQQRQYRIPTSER